MRVMLGCYNHVPDGLPDTSFEELYQACYRPFLSVLNRFPDVQCTVHYSGSLLRRLELRHAEYLMLLEEMVARRQVELLGGGFYAPILPLIPNSDRLGQIELLTTYLRKCFGRRPRGCWLSEYAWEPWLASTLQASGMDYTFLTDSQFAEALGESARPYSPVITEDQGRCLTILPVHDCSAGPGEPQGFVEAIEEMQAAGGDLAVIMAPGEGIRDLWERSGLESPDLYMERTFSWLRNRALELETVTPSRYFKARRQFPRAYFPGMASRRFMNDARSDCLPTSNGMGSVRRAILRSASSSALYSRMHFVHLVIGQLRGDKSRKKTAVDDLWRGQCADAYWDAPSGGIVRPAVRAAAYRALIEAEQTTRPKGSFKPGVVRADIDFDGAKELVYQGIDMNAFIHSRGGAIVELDMIKARRNLCDVFCVDGDGCPPGGASFVDRVFRSRPDDRTLRRPWTGDAGTFSAQYYEERPDPGPGLGVSLFRDGAIDLGGSMRQVALSKRYHFGRKALRVSYELRNLSAEPVLLWFGVETRLGVLDGELESMSLDGKALDPAAAYAGEPSSHEGIGQLRLASSTAPLTLTMATQAPATLALSGIAAETPGGETFQQGLLVFLLWELSLPADGAWHTELALESAE